MLDIKQKSKFINNEESLSDNETEKYFLNSLLSVAPRCALRGV